MKPEAPRSPWKTYWLQSRQTPVRQQYGLKDQYDDPQHTDRGGAEEDRSSPVPVIWEQLAVTEGIFSDDITKINAPDMAIRIRFLLFSFTLFLSEMNPAIRNGSRRAPHARSNLPAGSLP